jgi:SAM-dependent methyltransferase
VSRKLRPDDEPEDFVDFYRRVGEAQLEETYYGRHTYAVVRHHLLLGILAPYAARGESLLDVGCASGYYATRFAQRGGIATGADIAESSLQLARERAERDGVARRCEFVLGDLRELPVADGSCDVVLATEVLEHVREQRDALAELTRVLRPGGTLVVSVPGAIERLPWRRRIAARRARTPEDAGLTVERLGLNEVVRQAGIEHEPYFHDSFTLAGLHELLPPGLEVHRLCSLLFVPPRAVMYGFLLPRAVGRRLRRRRRAGPTSSTPEAHSGPVAIPEAYAEARAWIKWTRLLWRVPVIRECGHGVLLVARRPG